MDEIKLVPALIIGAGYVFTFISSTWIIKYFLIVPESYNAKLKRTGRIIGKCENFLVISFILADALTGLALIFAAKTLPRKSKEEEDNLELTNYFLAGTLLNFSYSLLMGFVLKYVWQLCI